jgi:hypothetical protein
MRNKQLHKSIEILLSTGIMAFIMSGTISAYRLGISPEMVSSWLSVYPVAWGFAIPAVIATRTMVTMLMRSLIKIITPKGLIC